MRSAFVGRDVEVFNLLADNPSRHGVDVEAFNVTADAVCLNQWCASTHKRIGDPDSREVICLKKNVFQAIFTKFREDKTTKQGPWSAGEPLVDANDRTIILLYLLFPERHWGDERDVEALFDTHRCAIVILERPVFPRSMGKFNTDPNWIVQSLSIISLMA